MPHRWNRCYSPHQILPLLRVLVLLPPSSPPPQINRQHVYQPLTSQNSTELATSPASNEEYVVQPSESPFQLGEKPTSVQPGSGQDGDYCTAREADGRKSTGSDD